MGIPVELALPENASEERKLILNNYGVKLHLTNPLEGTDGAQRFVDEIVADNQSKYFFPNQYANDNNWKAHVESTGPEIWAQSKQSVTHFVAGLGTTGTFMGTSRFLQPKGVHCVSVEPNTPMHGLEGWKHMETAIVPEIYDRSVANDTLVADTARSYELAKAASKYCGLMLSPSAAANLDAAMQLADGLKEGVIVTVFADNAMKYLTDEFWSDDAYTIENPFNEISTHAESEYPHECCGGLIGTIDGDTKIVTQVVPIENNWEDTGDETKTRRFMITSDDYRQLERKASDENAQLLGFYHSHPDHPQSPVKRI